MRVLITGARGQLGQSLRERIPEDWETIFTDSKTLDITNQTSVDAMVGGFQPEVIINTAAYTNVNKAEIETQQAFAVNATGVANLARAAQKHGSRLIHVSTDYVFDGNASTPYVESDAPNPINAYGKSKLAGEVLALSLCDRTTIVRTSWVYSEYSHNFVMAIVNKLNAGQQATIVENSVGTPTYAGDLAAYLIAIASGADGEKITHFSGETIVTRGELAQIIADVMHEKFGQDYHIGYELDQALPTDTNRPNYSVLQTLVQTQGKPIEQASLPQQIALLIDKLDKV